MTPWLTDYRHRQRIAQRRRTILEALGAAALGAGTVLVWYACYMWAIS